MYDNFFYKIKQSVYKWWCVVYKPVYKLTHNGYWPKEKEPYYIPDSERTVTDTSSQATDTTPSTEQNSNSTTSQANTLDPEQQRLLAEQMAKSIVRDNQQDVDKIVTNTEEIPAEYHEEIDTSNIDADVLSKANEIMERLAREAAADEEKKQSEIDKAKREADEQAKLNAIMQKNKVDISQFIEEGKANRQNNK